MPLSPNIISLFFMVRYGLIGFPVEHSFSKMYFHQKFEREGLRSYQYELFALPDITLLPELVKNNPDLRGLNVTLPHKEKVIALLDELDPAARDVGAVNCIKILPRNRLRGYNTDVFGFATSLLRFLERGNISPDGSWHALILGTGGAARAVAAVLQAWKVPYLFASRQPQRPQTISYARLKRLNWQQIRLVVNATPLGMMPHIHTVPELPFHLLTPEHFIFDLVYNPAETLLLQRAAAAGAHTQNGLEMLHWQAEKSWEIWQS